jgi:hypothetical protein
MSLNCLHLRFATFDSRAKRTGAIIDVQELSAKATKDSSLLFLRRQPEHTTRAMR